MKFHSDLCRAQARSRKQDYFQTSQICFLNCLLRVVRQGYIKEINSVTAKVWQKAVQELGQYQSTCNGLNLNSSGAVNNLYDSSLFCISSLF